MRVAVTTVAAAAARTSRLLDAVGLTPVLLPCIRVEPGAPEALARLRRHAASADWVLATSARALRVTWPDGMPPSPPVAAVGEVTAQTARRLGAVVGLVGAAGAVELAMALAPDVAGATVAWPAAAGADRTVVAVLASAGATVHTEAAYTTVPIPPGPEPVDAVVFASPSAVEGWRLSRSLDEVVLVAAVGATTARALDASGRRADIVPPAPSMQTIAAALAAHAERTASR